jgi:hypothetical protein
VVVVAKHWAFDTDPTNIGLANVAFRSEMRFPLLALVDLGGFRIIATARQPIGADDTLVYGSRNAHTQSFEFHNTDSDAEHVTRLLCEQMHLKSHRIQTSNGAMSIWGCYDMEVHKGYDDQYEMNCLIRCER